MFSFSSSPGAGDSVHWCLHHLRAAMWILGCSIFLLFRCHPGGLLQIGGWLVNGGVVDIKEEEEAPRAKRKLGPGGPLNFYS